VFVESVCVFFPELAAYASISTDSEAFEGHNFFFCNFHSMVDDFLGLHHIPSDDIADFPWHAAEAGKEVGSSDP
jgi:hypothetical protein